MRQWWRRHFKSEDNAPVAHDEFGRCSRCGQTYDTRDLHQVLPHFQHQLELGAEVDTTSPSADERLPSFVKVVPLRRGSQPPVSIRGIDVVAKADAAKQ